MNSAGQELLAAMQLPISAVSLVKEMPIAVTQFAEGGGAPAEGTLGELLKRGTEERVFEAMKVHGKLMIARGKGGPVSAAGKVVYLAAIAGALVSCGRKITTHSFEVLRDAFKTLNEMDWVPAYLKALARDACRLCEERMAE